MNREMISEIENEKYNSQIKSILHLIAGKRKELKISQTEMGKLLGISLNSYRLIELGQSHLKIKTLLILSDKVGLNFFRETLFSEIPISKNIESEN
jgi:DNA-binding XRE family transcriptional regulator